MDGIKCCAWQAISLSGHARDQIGEEFLHLFHFWMDRCDVFNVVFASVAGFQAKDSLLSIINIEEPNQDMN